MTRRVEVNPGELFAVSDRVILLREYEHIVGYVGKLGVPDNDRVATMLTFDGKLNNRDRSSSVTVLLDPDTALALTADILRGLALLRDAGLWTAPTEDPSP